MYLFKSLQFFSSKTTGFNDHIKIEHLLPRIFNGFPETRVQRALVAKSPLKERPYAVHVTIEVPDSDAR